MKACLTHKSALRFWRSAYALELVGPRQPFYKADTPYRPIFSLPKRLPNAPNLNSIIGASKTSKAGYAPLSQEPPSLTLANISSLASLGATVPCHVLVADNSCQRPRSFLKHHICAAQLPERAIVSLSPILSVASPELVFIQMAETFSLIELVEFGCECCGYYSLPLSSKGELGNRIPLTNLNALRQFVEKCKQVRGLTKAHRALRYILEGSNSPMETKLALLLTLPHTMGGYGLPKPQLNANVSLNKSAPFETMGRPSDIRTCDLLWRSGKIAVEYEGVETHQGAQRDRDARRPDELRSIDIEMINVTYGRLTSQDDMNNIAENLAKSIGYRNRIRTKDFPSAQTQLRKELHLE